MLENVHKTRGRSYTIASNYTAVADVLCLTFCYCWPKKLCFWSKKKISLRKQDLTV